MLSERAVEAEEEIFNKHIKVDVLADSTDQIAIALRLKSQIKHVLNDAKEFRDRHDKEAKEPMEKAKEAEKKIKQI